MTEQQELEQLLTRPWEGIVNSGGTITEQYHNGIYTILGGIIIQLQKKWFYMVSSEVAFDTGRDDYDFFIEISDAQFPLDPEEAKQNNPRLSEVFTFPDDCRLDYLHTYGVKKIEYDVHPKSYTQYYKDTNYGLLLKTPLLITSKNGYQFKIEPSEESLACLEISMISL